MAPAIVQEHPQFVIVNKPAGWLVHPTRPDGTFTLIDWLRQQYPGEFLSLISRLDRETSGILLVARGKETASSLGKMQQQRVIHKSYLAMVHGRPPSAGIINQPLDRIGKHRPSQIYIRQGVIPGGYPAVTEFITKETRTHPEHGTISLVEASPKTGRLHQIRAHFEHLGFPVLHDKIYGKDDQVFLNYIDKENNNLSEKTRHALHSAKIQFRLRPPDSELEIEFLAQIPLAPDLLEIWSYALPKPTEVLT